jgi:nicotinic acid phosphoribosyltransferase
MGGALLQEPTRDTQKFAMKASNAFVNKKNVEVYKDPVHDSGKSSKKGFQFLLRNKKTESIRTLNAKEYYARPFHQVMDEDLLLEIVYLNGRICRDDTFETIRENVK